MKTKISILFLVMATFAASAGSLYPGVLWSYTGTNNAAVNGCGGGGLYNLTNNGVVTVSNNVISGIVYQTQTNLFSPGYGQVGVAGTQATTNLWPSVGFNLLSTYPNTYAPPANNVNIQISSGLMATNGSAIAETVRFYGSDDGLNWVSNYFVTVLTMPATNNATSTNINYYSWMTNFTTGGMAYISLQAIENPGAVVISNVNITASIKPGI